MNDSRIQFDLACSLKAKEFNGLSHDLFHEDGVHEYNIYTFRWNESEKLVTQPTYQEALLEAVDYFNNPDKYKF